MCGIVAVASEVGGAARLAFEAIKHLEYRGYDSFGIAAIVDDSIVIRKDVGPVSGKESDQYCKNIEDSSIAIAHTRWATHGDVSVRNAHPHLSYDSKFALVHNGVIENYVEIRSDLASKGISCVSDTDTEVIVHLLALHFQRTGDVIESLKLTIDTLSGEYAFVFICIASPKSIFGARRKSPLATSIGDHTSILASDQLALAPYANTITHLEDGDIVYLQHQRCSVLARAGNLYAPVARSQNEIHQSYMVTGRQGHDHYMIKEIFEAPEAVRSALDIDDEVLLESIADMHGKQVYLSGSGSSFYVSLLGQYYFSLLAHRHVPAFPSDEFFSLARIKDMHHVLTLSQSGETFDTVEVVRAAKESGASVTSVNNVHGSTCQRLATYAIMQNAGPEICVLSTKSIISQALILCRMALLMGVQNMALGRETEYALRVASESLPERIEQLFDEAAGSIQCLATRHFEVSNWFFVGRAMQTPVALESALKFKEVSYLHAEGMPAGFFKHGTISLIDDDFYSVAFLPSQHSDPRTFRFMETSIAEIHARGGRVLAIGHEALSNGELSGPDSYVQIPDVNAFLNPLLELVAGQLLAYFMARALGRNIDQPRALAKSVTVR